MARPAQSSVRRDVALFLAAALLPTAIVGGLGWRAAENEALAVGREASAVLEATTQRGVRTLEEDLARGGESLARVVSAARGVMDAGARRGATPAHAEAFVFDASGALVEPTAPGLMPRPASDPACAEAVVRLGAGDAAARTTILARCETARDADGRWLWPVLALGALTRAEDAALTARVSAFLAENAGALSNAERAAARNELSRARLDGATRAALERALTTSGGSAGAVAATLRTDAVSRVIRAAESGAPRTFRSGGAAGVVIGLPEGGAVGFVITAETLARSLESDAAWLEAPSEVVVRAAAPGAAPSTTPPRTVAWLTEGVGLSAELRAPGGLAARSASRRRWIVALTVGGGAVALGLAGALAARLAAARRTSQLRTDFVAAVSHELRTPIGSVRMLSELLADAKIEEGERAEVAGAIARETTRMGETVERLLGYARIASGKLVARTAPGRMDALVRARVAAFEARYPEVKVEVEVAPITAPIDGPLLELALDNLLENARRHAPDGQPYEVSLSLAGGDAELAVRDRGPGVPRGAERRIFEAFERADDRLSQATSGTGVGLYLVAQAARAHGGGARVERPDDGGARFVLRVPGASTARGGETEIDEGEATT